MIKIKSDIIVTKNKIHLSKSKEVFHLYEFLNDTQIHTQLLNSLYSKSTTITYDKELPLTTQKKLESLFQKFQIKYKKSVLLQIKTQIFNPLIIIITLNIGLLITSNIQNNVIKNKKIFLDQIQIQNETKSHYVLKKIQIQNTKIANYLPLIFKIPIDPKQFKITNNQIQIFGKPYNNNLQENLKNIGPFDTHITQQNPNEIKLTISPKT